MAQGKNKFTKPSKEVKKTAMQAKKRKGKTSAGPKKTSLTHKLNTALSAEIGRSIEKTIAAKYAQSGGSLSILKQG
jgi:hypothetical protein